MWFTSSIVTEQNDDMNGSYLIKLWLSTIIVTPILLILLMIFDSGGTGISGIISFYILYMVFSLGFSIPAFLVLFLLSFILDENITRPAILKACYIGISLVCMMAT